MPRIHIQPAAIASLLMLTLCVPVPAKIRIFSLLELAEQSDLVFVGKVMSVGEEYATVTIDEVLSGILEEDSVSVSPIFRQHCLGQSINFTANEEVLVFGRKTNSKHVVVTGGGLGKITLDPANREMDVQAVSRLLSIAPQEEDRKNQAMLALVRSGNDRLRAEARRYVVSRISHSDLRNQYKDDVLALIEDADPEIQITGLQGLQFIQAPDAVARIAALTKSENPGVVSAASMALAQYDTPESVAALIALTKHENPGIRSRACIDIDRSRRPEAKEALEQLLYDEDPAVRAIAPRGLVYWLRRNDADDVLPRLVEMLNDDDPGVRAAAADKLGDCINSELIPPLLDALRQEPKDEAMKRAILRSLYCQYSKGDATARLLIDRDIQLIVRVLKAGGPNDAYGPSFQAVGILDLSPETGAENALRWAARNHPNKEIQAYAGRCL